MYKVGILTFQNAINYGAFLQTYALQEILSDIAEVCEVINYKADFIEKDYNPFRIKKNIVKSLGRIILKSKIEIEKSKIFQRSSNQYLNLSTECKTTEKLKEVCEKYDIVYCGSDQIWNCRITKNDLNYFLPFALEKTKKCSYAASFGTFDISKLSENAVDALNQFNKISVREESSVETLSRKVENSDKIEVDLDPTLLLDKNDWSVFGKAIKEETPYILIYCVKAPNTLIKKAIEFSKEHNIRIIQIHYYKVKNKNINYVLDAGPSEFVSYFKNAKYVFTDSFHGTVFSIIFNKLFVTEMTLTDGTYNNRVAALLKLLELENRTIESGINPIEPINWSEVNTSLSSLRNNSISRLKN